MLLRFILLLAVLFYNYRDIHSMHSVTTYIRKL